MPLRPRIHRPLRGTSRHRIRIKSVLPLVRQRPSLRAKTRRTAHARPTRQFPSRDSTIAFRRCEGEVLAGRGGGEGGAGAGRVPGPVGDYAAFFAAGGEDVEVALAAEGGACWGGGGGAAA